MFIALANTPTHNIPLDGVSEGDHICTISHAITSSNAAGYPTSLSILDVNIPIAELFPPVVTVTSDGSGATADVDVAEQSTAITTVVTTGATSLTITGGVDRALFSLVSNTGALTFITAPDFEIPTDANGDNIYQVVVTASDGTNSDSQLINVHVTNANDAGTVVITGEAKEGITLTATVTDADGATGTITYQWKAGGNNISGATASSYLLTQSEVGKVITVQASYTDDRGTSEAPISPATTSVSNVNDAPVITSTAGTTATENSQYTYAPQVTDKDGDTLTWTISGEPTGMTISAATGAVSWTPTGGVTSSGAVTITVTDNGTGALTDTETFTVTVILVTDTDGVSDAEEQAAPNVGDGNGDGIADAIQANVSSVSGQTANTYYTLDLRASPACVSINAVSTTTEADLGSGIDPFGFDYEAGLVSFTLNCSSANVVLYLHGLTQAPEQIRKYGLTPSSPGTKVWYRMPATITAVTIGGETVYKVSYTLIDGDLGDDDLIQNGVIVDPVGEHTKRREDKAVHLLLQYLRYLSGQNTC